MINGYKTYIGAALLIGYVLGEKLGYWKADPQVLAGIGACIAASLRHAIAKASDGAGTPAAPASGNPPAFKLDASALPE
jgi:hypothetical protein